MPEELRDPINLKIEAGKPLTAEEADAYLAAYVMSDADQARVRASLMAGGGHFSGWRRGPPKPEPGSLGERLHNQFTAYLKAKSKEDARLRRNAKRRKPKPPAPD